MIIQMISLKNQKKKLRKELTAEKKKFSIDEKRDFSEAIWCSLELIPDFQKSEVVLLYYSLPDEVYTHQFIEKWSDKKTILLPVVVQEQLVLRPYDKSKLVSGVFGIQEPVGVDFTDWDTIDLIIVPALGYDRQGNRIGRGGGYYDRLLPQLKATKIGVCFPFQLVDKVPTEEFDSKVDRVIYR